MKRLLSRIPGFIKILVAVLVLSTITLCLALGAEGNAVEILYTTLGGTWVQVDENTWTMDKDGDGVTDITLKKNQNEWKYMFQVEDPTAQYYAWEEDVPEGYEVSGGSGERRDPASNSRYAYSHTPNVDDDGIRNGNYPNNQNTTDVVTIPGAERLHVTLTYQTQGTSNDWVCMWEGDWSSSSPASDYGSSKTGKLGGTTKTTKEYDIIGDTVTFGFRSDGSTNGYFGYYAVVQGKVSNIKITNKSTRIPSGGLQVSKKIEGTEDTVTDHFKFVITLDTDDEDLKPYLSGSYDFGDVHFTDGVGVTYLQDGDSVSIRGIPAGLKYDIEEDKPDGYTVSWEGGTSENDHCTGIIQEDVTDQILCTNIKIQEETVQTQPLVVKKSVVNGTPDVSFQFLISLWNLSPNTVYTMEKDGVSTFTSNESGMASIVFSLKDGESVKMQLPVDTQYKINEDANAYVASFEIENGSKMSQQKGGNLAENLSLSTAKETIEEGENATVHFTNTKVPREQNGYIDISVEKIWDDCEDQGNIRPDHINVKLLQDGEEISYARLDALSDWKTVFTDLEEYQDDGVTKYEYSIQEISVPRYTTAVSSKETEDGLAFMVKNTGHYDLSVNKTVEGNWGNRTKDFSFKITFSGEKEIPSTLEYEKGEEKGTMQLTDGAGTFTLAHGESIVLKNIPAGITYQIEETNAEGYTVEATNESGILKCDTSATFVNQKKGVIPTSADTNNDILLELLFAALAGIGWILYRKRKHFGKTTDKK
ncbi:MAG: Cna B-type domain-containing protein [Lachnospiraceae bacterium]